MDMVRKAKWSLLKGHGGRDLDTVRSTQRHLGKGQREERSRDPEVRACWACLSHSKETVWLEQHEPGENDVRNKPWWTTWAPYDGKTADGCEFSPLCGLQEAKKSNTWMIGHVQGQHTA